MAYSNTGLSLVGQSVSGASKIWLYKSADDDATVNGAGYFSDGVTFDMAANDIVFVIDTATPKVSLCSVTSVSGNAATTIFGAVA